MIAHNYNKTKQSSRESVVSTFNRDVNAQNTIIPLVALETVTREEISKTHKSRIQV